MARAERTRLQRDESNSLAPNECSPVRVSVPKPSCSILFVSNNHECIVAFESACGIPSSIQRAPQSRSTSTLASPTHHNCSLGRTVNSPRVLQVRLAQEPGADHGATRLVLTIHMHELSYSVLFSNAWSVRRSKC